MNSSCGRSSWSPAWWRRGWAGCRRAGRPPHVTSRDPGGVTADKGRMAMPGIDTDVIDTLAGIKPGTALDAIRHRRPDARNQAQESYRALFAPEIAGGVAAT